VVILDGWRIIGSPDFGENDLKLLDILVLWAKLTGDSYVCTSD